MIHNDLTTLMKCKQLNYLIAQLRDYKLNINTDLHIRHMCVILHIW